MEKGYSKQSVEQNIEALIAEGVQPQLTLAKAIGRARTEYKKAYPDSINFPKHIAVGNIANTYLTGGEDGG